ncbi:motility associated factor glycosyltransferase family protein [Robertmurraya massiliosenegalensis]|uniref:motility associated factor glycosyltransferase family protein n=1 Tax=Robertmurraya massiliosenegalensis TaxID=1287657 RepID=UPI0002D958BE|nr:6-hydroxymethylpterin diphosphokinase MptE-like protein [Robertmurraya massiliosenegalensis]
MKFWEENLQAGRHLCLDTLVKQSSLVESESTLEISKIGAYTLKVNGHYIYSKYDPIKDAKKFIESQIEDNVKEYYLFGFGLGYHALALIALEPDKPIYIVESDMNMLRMALDRIDLRKLLSRSNIKFITHQNLHEYIHSYDDSTSKLIIPGAWLNALSKDHPLKELLQDIKMKKITYERFSQRMKENFQHNIKQYDLDFDVFIEKFSGLKAVLVSAGPSLEDNIGYLKQLKDRYFIFSVGSALRVLLNSGVIPNAVIVTDPQDALFDQLSGLNWMGPLVFLPTANSRAVEAHKGLKVIAFQNGYLLSEKYVRSRNLSLVETGGSVATTGLDLLIRMGFTEIVFFGQDLAMPNMQSHAEGSNSKSKIVTDLNLIEVIANDGTVVKTKNNLNLYRKWIEKKIKETPMVAYKNTAYQGAKITGAPYVAAEDIIQETNNMEKITLFDDIITSIGKKNL